MGRASTKFVHAADIHLDSPMRGLERYEGAPVEAVRSATRDALVNLVQLAIDEEAEFVVVAGDLYDGDWKDYNTGLFLVSQLHRLRERGIRVLVISGNHDAASRITRALRMPEGVTLFSTERPQTIVLDDLEVAVHGQGYSSQAVMCNLVPDYPEPLPGYFNVGLLHTSADGRPGHLPYAPCSLQDLVAKGYDYWALGHVHQYEVVLSPKPWVIFPGNLQGRHARETGAKGAVLVTVEDRAVVAVEHRKLDVVRWVVADVDVSEALAPQDVVERVIDELDSLARQHGDRILAARVRITGRTAAHEALARDPDRWVNELRAAAIQLSEQAWVEKVRLDTRSQTPVRGTGEEGARVGPLDDLLQQIQALRQDPSGLEEFLSDFADLRGKLPPEYRTGDDALDLSQASALCARLDQVEQLLAGRLAADGEQG